MATDRNEYIARNSEYNYNEDLVSFSLVDESTVRKLQKDGKVVLPQKKIDIPKDMRWNEKQMGSKLMQGIQNGYSIPKIANSLLEVIGNNKASATRNARTMTTSAENGGRLDSYKDLQARGVVQKKKWMATPDDRTRKSHIDIDGEEQDIDAEFSNGCMYPADGHGPSEEVWNCRCSMHTHIIGFRRADGSISRVNYDRDKTMHDTQMDAERARRAQLQAQKGRKATPTPAKAKAREELKHGDQAAYQYIVDRANANNVAFKEVADLKEKLTEQQIIEKIAGGDMTKGSCVSVATAYIGNKIGYDVQDFRGGKSQDVFSRVWKRIPYTANAKTVDTFVKKEVSGTAKLLKDIEMNKQYLLQAGKHTAIVRKTKEGLQYLELQSAKNNGWKPFAGKMEVASWKWDPDAMQYIRGTTTISKTVAETLNERFGCRKTVGGLVQIAEVDSFERTAEFKGILGYINTDAGKQMKGVKGSVK